MRALVRRNKSRGRKAFTLVELLVVMGIIGILAAILMPAVFAARKKARRLQAEGDVAAIASAVRAYLAEYGKLPLANDAHQGDPDEDHGYYADQQSKDVIKILIGEDTTRNPRKISFLEVPGGKVDGEFLDPWEHQYIIKMDCDYDGRIDYHTVNPDIVAPVIVISLGADGQSNTGDVPPGGVGDDIYSYKFN